MNLTEFSIHRLHLAMSRHSGGDAVEKVTQTALANANSNQGRNTYLWRDEVWTMMEAARAAEEGVQHAKGRFGDFYQHSALWGIPISVKDCFDLAGAPTSCGTKFYRDLNGVVEEDSWVVEHLRKNGAVITGKTHLHPLAYGITGENPDFGDCLQPGRPDALTGGSSSGAAASVMEGSAMAAIGTDTGGSIRVPAALCGLVGYRASLGWGDWRGGAHLAPSFDTMGWLFRHLEDGVMLGKMLEPYPPAAMTLTELVRKPKTVAVIDEAFLHDCEPAVIEGFRAITNELQELGLKPTSVNVDWWSDSREIFAPIQASEAARIHEGHYDAFESSICERLKWGASLGAAEIGSLRLRHEAFRERMDALLAEHEFLVMPAAPVTRLPAGADHSETRARLLRYTTPVSLAGMPAVTIPCTGSLFGAGVQLVAARGKDRQLLSLIHRLGEARKKRVPR